MKPGIFETGRDWVAVRGGIHDWAIYKEDPQTGVGYPNGSKLMDEDLIKKLVPADDEAMAMYRF